MTEMTPTAHAVDTYATTTGQADQEPISTPMIAALEQAWSAIRQHHPDVPPAVVVLGSGSLGSTTGTLRLGHFAAMRWHTDRPDTSSGGQLAEVFIGGEGLRRGAVEVLGTLLHEAAHALADVRGIKDTSRQGRYHNTRFKELAEELGIEVTKDPRLGWSPTTVPGTTSEPYAQTITALADALQLYRASEPTSTGTKRKNPPACVCECGRRIRAATSVLDAGPITCGLCGTDFQPDEQD